MHTVIRRSNNAHGVPTASAVKHYVNVVSEAESPFTFCSGFVLADWRVKRRGAPGTMARTFFKMPLSFLAASNSRNGMVSS